VQRTNVDAARERLLGLPRRAARMVGRHVQVGVHLRVDALDAVEIRVDGLQRRHLSGADPARQDDRGLVAEIVAIHGVS